MLFATYVERPDLTADDCLLAAALAQRGITVRAARWDDPATSWRDAAAVIVRSTWDYYRRRDEFLDWTERVATETVLHNTPPVIRWNSHKGYLAELAARGIPVIDTVFAAAGSDTDVVALAAVHEWDDVVIKPAVSAAAYETRLFRATERAAAQAHLDRLLVQGDAMLQPHLAALGERGELSAMFARGRFTHAVRRRSALASGATLPKSAAAEAPPAALRLANRVLEEASALVPVPEAPLYARVDLAETPPHGFQLLELELIEPSLFFGNAPASAAEQMADAILSRL